MNVSLTFVRVFFSAICLLLFSAYTTTMIPGGFSLMNLVGGLVGGFLFSMLLIGLEASFKEVNLRSFNVLALGLFCGYLMGEVVMLIFNAIVSISALPLSLEILSFVRMGVFLFSAYFAVSMVLRGADELYISIPFIKFKPSNQKKKDILIDMTALLDTRIIDLAASGLLDNHLIVPKFLIKELNYLNEQGDEVGKAKARKCLESLKKLENTPSLEIQYTETDFPEIKDMFAKLTKLAGMMNANIITADLNRLQQNTASGNNTRLINLHTLANALKPITQNGEFLSIKIQRYGKEPRQGIGYLDDGTMVVVNGGAEYIGDTIKAQVLSVKHTSSGRMIFCNTTEEHLLNEQNAIQSIEEMGASHKSYFTL